MSTPNQRDLVIIGGGPAGYSAALYAARASLDTLVVEQGMPGGQIATSDMIDNYPGIEQCSGAELGQKMQAHAESAGAQSTYGSVQSLTRHESGFTITTDMDSIEAKSVIVATGATPRPGNFSGEEMYGDEGYRIAPLATACFIVVNTCSSSAAATLPSRRRSIYRILPIR